MTEQAPKRGRFAGIKDFLHAAASTEDPVVREEDFDKDEFVARILASERAWREEAVDAQKQLLKTKQQLIGTQGQLTQTRLRIASLKRELKLSQLREEKRDSSVKQSTIDPADAAALGLNPEFLGSLPETQRNQVVQGLHKILSKFWHPDTGGETADPKRMAEVNVATDHIVPKPPQGRIG